MLIDGRIEGISPFLQNSGMGIDEDSEIEIEIKKITKKKGDKTATEKARLKKLKVLNSLCRGEKGEVIVPPSYLRGCIENAARKSKEGPAVREGLLVLETRFEHKYGEDLETLIKEVAFSVPVVVQWSRIMGTRAKFDLPWAVEFRLEVDEDLVDMKRLTAWLELGGRRIGIGDWRPQRSGTYGRFRLAWLRPVEG